MNICLTRSVNERASKSVKQSVKKGVKKAANKGASRRTNSGKHGEDAGQKPDSIHRSCLKIGRALAHRARP